MLSFTEYYVRNLPHWQPPGAILFITFRTAGALPKAVETKLRNEARLYRQTYDHLPYDSPELVLLWKRLFKYADEHLDKSRDACFLKSAEAAAIVADSIWRGQELKHYILHRYCVMPNHVHLVIEPLPENLDAAFPMPLKPMWPPMFYTDEGRDLLKAHCRSDELVWRPIGKILKAMKGSTARGISKAVGIPAPIWMPESYDHWLRNGQEYERLLAYVDNNPVKAGLSKCLDGWQCGSAGCKRTGAIYKVSMSLRLLL